MFPFKGTSSCVPLSGTLWGTISNHAMLRRMPVHLMREHQGGDWHTPNLPFHFIVIATWALSAAKALSAAFYPCFRLRSCRQHSPKCPLEGDAARSSLEGEVDLGCFHTWFACLVRTRVRLLPPPPASAGLHSYYLIWVWTAVHLRHQASSCLPRCLVTTAWEKAAKCITLLSALLYIYVFEPFVLFTKLQCITALTSVLRMCCKCSKERWRRTEMRHTAFCLQRVSHARQESEWSTHTNTHFHQIIRN